MSSVMNEKTTSNHTIKMVKGYFVPFKKLENVSIRVQGTLRTQK